MIIAARLFMGMGLFGLVAGAIYWLTNDNPELAGVGMLGAFFFASLFIGVILWSASPANRRRQPAPDTGLPGSASQERGAADEHGNIHHMAPTFAPIIYALAATVLLGGFIYRKQVAALGPWGIGLGVALFLGATVIWYRAVGVDTHALLAPHGAAHTTPADADTPEVPEGPPGPANYFEQLREAMEVGDPDWAAAAYATDAVYYEPANPPHEGRESIRAYLNDLLKGHRDLRVDVQRIGVNGDSAIVEWTWSFRIGNRRISDQPGASVIQVGPSGIVYHRDYL
ncbi:MAG TPA: nuclear transport factor 2 family protein [Actinomycetota bacterium]|nr:nuclear transport factor 2 family protein [Actinomycetota bacterium]